MGKVQGQKKKKEPTFIFSEWSPFVLFQVEFSDPFPDLFFSFARRIKVYSSDTFFFITDKKVEYKLDI